MRASANRLRVLVAEDSASTAALLAGVSANIPGFEVVGHATSVRDACRLAAEVKPDLVLTGLSLAGGSLDVMRFIRGHGLTAVIIVAIADPSPHCRAICLEAGADFVFDTRTEVERMITLLSGALQD